MKKTNTNPFQNREKELMEEAEAHSPQQGASTSSQQGASTSSQQGASTSSQQCASTSSQQGASTSSQYVESTTKQQLEKWTLDCIEYIAKNPEVAYKVMTKGFGRGPVGRIVNIFKRNPEKKMERDWEKEISQYYQNNDTRAEALRMIQLGHTKRILALEKEEQKINEVNHNLLMDQQRNKNAHRRLLEEKLNLKKQLLETLKEKTQIEKRNKVKNINYQHDPLEEQELYDLQSEVESLTIQVRGKSVSTLTDRDLGRIASVKDKNKSEQQRLDSMDALEKKNHMIRLKYHQDLPKITKKYKEMDSYVHNLLEVAESEYEDILTNYTFVRHKYAERRKFVKQAYENKRSVLTFSINEKKLLLDHARNADLYGKLPPFFQISSDPFKYQEKQKGLIHEENMVKYILDKLHRVYEGRLQDLLSAEHLEKSELSDLYENTFKSRINYIKKSIGAKDFQPQLFLEESQHVGLEAPGQVGNVHKTTHLNFFAANEITTKEFDMTPLLDFEVPVGTYPGTYLGNTNKEEPRFKCEELESTPFSPSTSEVATLTEDAATSGAGPSTSGVATLTEDAATSGAGPSTSGVATLTEDAATSGAGPSTSPLAPPSRVPMGSTRQASLVTSGPAAVHSAATSSKIPLPKLPYEKKGVKETFSTATSTATLDWGASHTSRISSHAANKKEVCHMQEPFPPTPRLLDRSNSAPLMLMNVGFFFLAGGEKTLKVLEREIIGGDKGDKG